MARARTQRKSQEALSATTAKQPAAAFKERRSWRGHGWRLLAIWGLLAIAYSNSFQAGLIFDNATIIGRDSRIRQATPQNLEAILTGGYRSVGDAAGLYRPLSSLSYLVNYAVLGNGPRPSGYHWVNLALHGVNVALAYALGIAVFGATAPAWAMATIWGLHPLLTESVTNIVGRADLLAAFGVLAGLLCYVKAGSAAGRRRLAWLAGIAASQAAGLFSKESAVVLPGLMLLYDLAGFERAAWRRRSSAFAALALPFTAFFYLRSQAGQHMVIPFADNPLVRAGFWPARLTAIEVIGRSLWLFSWPAKLSADYSYNAVPLFGSNWEDVLAVTACLAAALLILILSLRARRSERPMLFFLAFFFIAILPTSNLIVLIGSIMAERFLYLPSVALAGFVVAGVYALGQRMALRRPLAMQAAWAALGVLCIAFAARTYVRNPDWNDELSLWQSTVNVAPGSAKAHYNLGKALESVPGRLPQAIAEYRAALGIEPDQADVHNNLANALSATPGKLPEAIAEFQAALRLAPDRAEPHNDVANALARIPGRLPEAIAEYQAALRLQPDSAEIHYNLANALARIPDGLALAMDEYRAALRIDPNHADAHTNLGNTLARMPGRMPDAIAEYRAALRIEPDSAGAHIALGNALSSAPSGLAEAVAEYRAALRVRPNDAEAHYDLGTALAAFPGRLPEAISEFQSALRAEPNFPEALVNLGNALAQTPGRRLEAITQYEAALRLRPDPVVRQMLERLRAER